MISGTGEEWPPSAKIIFFMSIYAHTVSYYVPFFWHGFFFYFSFGLWKRTCLVKIIGILVVVLGYYEALFISSRGD